MCDPVSVSAVAAVTATAFTAYTAVEQGNYQKGVAEYNARLAENEAEETRRAGVEAENEQRRKTAELISRQRAQLGAANVDLGSGSALQLQEDAATLGEADALRIRSNVGEQFDALQSSATLTRSQGEFAQSAGQMSAVGSLLGGTTAVLKTGVADKWFTPDSAAIKDDISLVAAGPR